MLPLILQTSLMRSYGLRAKAVLCQGVSGASRTDISIYILRESHQLLDRFRVLNVKDHPHIKALRKFMRSTGLDISKIRPSPEALLRRALRKGFIPPSNPLSDIGYVTSIENMVPVTVMDYDGVEEPLMLRPSLKGERFPSWRGSELKLSGHEVVLADSSQRILHLLPYRDGPYGRVNKDTRNAIFLTYAVRGIPEMALMNSVLNITDLINRFYPKAECVEAPVHL